MHVPWCKVGAFPELFPLVQVGDEPVLDPPVERVQSCAEGEYREQHEDQCGREGPLHGEEEIHHQGEYDDPSENTDHFEHDKRATQLTLVQPQVPVRRTFDPAYRHRPDEWKEHQQGDDPGEEFTIYTEQTVLQHRCQDPRSDDDDRNAEYQEHGQGGQVGTQ